MSPFFMVKQRKLLHINNSEFQTQCVTFCGIRRGVRKSYLASSAKAAQACFIIFNFIYRTFLSRYLLKHLYSA